MTCQICFNPQRKVRFQSVRLIICQWCIKLIGDKDLTPKKIIDNWLLNEQIKLRKNIDSNIKKLQKAVKPPPEIDKMSFSRAEYSSLREIQNKESLAILLYRSLIDDSARVIEANKIASEKKREILSGHRLKLEEHEKVQRDILDSIVALENELTHINERAKLNLDEYLSNVFQDCKKITKEIKILRAYCLGLVNYDQTISGRLEKQQTESLNSKIRTQDEHSCICCGRRNKGELHVHHIISLKNYGTNNEQNLVTLCHPCHNKQHPGFQVTRNFSIKRLPYSPKFVSVDIETTGFSRDDSIIEIAAARFVDGKLDDTFQSLVYSDIKIPHLITSLTGITQDKIDMAPDADIVFREFEEFIKSSTLVFHNASFDMRFIKKYTESYNININNSVIDTLKLARKKNPELENHKLSTLVRYYRLDASSTHRALDDCIATGLLYIHLSKSKKVREFRNQN